MNTFSAVRTAPKPSGAKGKRKPRMTHRRALRLAIDALRGQADAARTLHYLGAVGSCPANAADWHAAADLLEQSLPTEE